LIPGPVFLIGCDLQAVELGSNRTTDIEKSDTRNCAERRRVSLFPVFLGPYARHEAQRNPAERQNQAGGGQQRKVAGRLGQYVD